MTDFVRLLFYGAEIVGTIAFAASGAMLAIDRELDLFGVIVLGAITAVGGGIMRDVLLGTFPPNAFTSSEYVLIAIVTSLLVFLIARIFGRRYWNSIEEVDKVMNLLDAVGLGVFSVVGVQMVVDMGYMDNAFLCMVMGMMSGVGGGVLRDVMSQTVPAILKKRIYAVASLAGAALYYAMLCLNIGGPAAMLSGMAVTVVIRVLATHYQWDLPKVPHP